MSDPAPGRVIGRKAANALFPRAELSSTLGKVLTVAGVDGPVKRTLAAFSLAHGGLWVGGRAELTDTALHFRPNRLNRVLHEQGEALVLDVPLADITAAQRRFGFISGIVDITTDSGCFSLRCFGARGLAAQIRDAAKIG